MTADSRSDRDLVALLEDLYLGPSPDYRDEALTAATTRRQRPSWSFGGRWLPMADIVSMRPVTSPPIRWRSVAVAMALIALLIAGVAIVAGSRQVRVPPPFGLARNGDILYSAEGDVYVADPQTGRTTTLVTGPAADTDPTFSPDGTRIAFSRRGDPDSPSLDIMVADADGSHVHALTTTPLDADGLRFEWASDSRSIAVQTATSDIWLLDAATQAPPRVVATHAELYLRPARPPDGTQFLVKLSGSPRQIAVLDVATGAKRVIVDLGGSDDFGSARWSPDGSQVVYSASAPEDRSSERLWIVNADGTGARQITREPGTWFDIDPTWSPDGKSIAFLRYQRTSTSPVTWDVRPTGIYDVATGTVRTVDPLPREVRAQRPAPDDASASLGEGFSLEWSPDGTSLLALPTEAKGHPVIIDPSTNTWRALDVVLAPTLAAQAWQRTAP
jgi:dipeptidyl aminopeptidase/acylaminoacyl peptidase